MRSRQSLCNPSEGWIWFWAKLRFITESKRAENKKSNVYLGLSRAGEFKKKETQHTLDNIAMLLIWFDLIQFDSIWYAQAGSILFDPAPSLCGRNNRKSRS